MKKYSVVSVKQTKVKPIVESIVVHGKSPMSAARKAFNKIYRLHDVRTGVITIKDHETQKEHKYNVTRKRVNKKVMHDGKEVVYKYETNIQSMRNRK
jgi:hypothetical protein